MARQNNQGGQKPASYVDEDAGIHSAERRSDAPEDDERLNDDVRSAPAGRDDDAREMSTREVDSSEHLRRFQQAMFQSALPDLPKIDGYHSMWLTTTNVNDSVAGRLQIGYELIRVNEVPGLRHSEVKTGEYAGYLMVNEMIAAKIPLELYNAFMNHSHHTMPLDEENKLKAVTEVIAEEARRKSGRAPDIGDGTAELGKGPAVGRFEGMNG